MSERAEARSPAEAAAEAVKAYIRMNRDRLAVDGELLSLLLPERFRGAGVSDFQQHVIERLRNENAALRSERDGLRSAQDRAPGLGAGVKRLLLELLDARTFEEAISVATAAAPVFGGDRAALCVEGHGSGPRACNGVRLIAPGTVLAVLGREGNGAILSGGGEVFVGPEFHSIALFRLRISQDAPAAVYVVAARESGRFEGEETAADIGFFARALERSIRTWLNLPKI